METRNGTRPVRPPPPPTAAPGCSSTLLQQPGRSSGRLCGCSDLPGQGGRVEGRSAVVRWMTAPYLCRTLALRLASGLRRQLPRLWPVLCATLDCRLGFYWRTSSYWWTDRSPSSAACPLPPDPALPRVSAETAAASAHVPPLTGRRAAPRASTLGAAHLLPSPRPAPTLPRPAATRRQKRRVRERTEPRGEADERAAAAAAVGRLSGGELDRVSARGSRESIHTETAATAATSSRSLQLSS